MVSDAMKNRVFGKSGGKCYVCRIAITAGNHDCAHIKAIRCGGTDEYKNLESCYSECNNGCRICNLNTYKKWFNNEKTKLDVIGSEGVNALVRENLKPRVSIEVKKLRKKYPKPFRIADSTA